MADLQGFQSLSCGWRRLGDLPDRAVRARQLRQFHLLEIVTDVAPGIVAGMLRNPFEQQGQHGQRNMRVNPMRRPVIDRAQLQPAFEAAPRLLDALQLLVAERHVLATERVVIAMDHELAVEPGGSLDLGLIDHGLAGLAQAQIAPITATGAQRTHPLAVARAWLVAKALEFRAELV